MRGKLFAATAFAVACLGAAAPVRADTTDDLLKRLLAKGILSQEEYDQLAAKHATDQVAPIATAPAGGAVSSGAAGTGETLAAPSSGTQPTPASALDKHVVMMTDSGLGLQLGPVTVKLSGSVNGFYVHSSGDDATPQHSVAGGLATIGQSSSAVRNGLIPGFVKIDVTTTQAGWDVGAHFALWPGLDSVSGVGGANSAGTPTALATAGIDARQTYLTLARSNFGELKIGRDLGLFAGEAILDDMTLLGVGTALANSAPSNTSLGRIGVGYLYADFQPQITYTSPIFNGFQVAVGAFQPLVTAGGSEVNDDVGIQARGSYDYKSGDLGARFYVGVLSQKHSPVAASATTGALQSYTGTGVDFGTKITYGPASLVGYGYVGSGIGTTGLFILSTDANGRKRDSSGFYVQGTYTLAKKLTLGVSYGESRLDLARGEINPALLDKNSSYIFQARYALTTWFSFVGEYTHTISDAQSDAISADSDAVSVGGILFF